MQTLDDSLVNDLLSFYSDHGSCNSQISVCSILTFYHQPSPRNVFFGFIRPDVWSLLSIASCFARKTCSRLLLYCHLPTALYQLKFFQKEYLGTDFQTAPAVDTVIHHDARLFIDHRYGFHRTVADTLVTMTALRVFKVYDSHLIQPPAL